MIRGSTARAAAVTLAALMAWLVLGVAACTAPSMSAAAPNPTAFIATRVVVLLTQNALTDTSARVLGLATATPPARPPAESAATSVPGQPTSSNGSQAGQAAPQSAATTEPNPTATPCGDQACAAAAGHFWLDRPIPEGYVNYPDRTYPFGSTAGGLREPHHGVEFENPSGTPIVAAASGQVIVAGDDQTTRYGPTTNFYGNLVVIQLDQTLDGQPVFNLYGHEKTVLVAVGQHVTAGQQIGEVGATGVAIGPHLHFEVRVGRDTYTANRNPELWLKPLVYNGLYQGAVAGRVVDTRGRLVDGYPVVIRPLVVDSETPRSRYLTTYTPDANDLGGDTLLQENFGTTDLALGSYTISVNTTQSYQQVINVTSGSLTWVTFVVAPPPPTPFTPTPTP